MDSEDKTSPVTLTRCPLDAVSLSGSSSVSHASGGDEEVRRLMDKIEKNVLTDGDSDLEASNLLLLLLILLKVD
ncbi:hypothetical protein LOAG_14304 [Loa loa]|uniref:Uncharacterized protein n=1 Tax=Loa loa TaxID=7209 RepID=A0A1S0THY4_LOALO|nr:hypothetical protein LOAG_14304 [Loa loa]EFO14219.1 hypothetical protein LOAG_14304 [Loa loa]